MIISHTVMLRGSDKRPVNAGAYSSLDYGNYAPGPIMIIIIIIINTKYPVLYPTLRVNERPLHLSMCMLIQ